MKISFCGFLSFSSGLCFVLEGEWKVQKESLISCAELSISCFVPLECKRCTLCWWGNRMKSWEKRWDTCMGSFWKPLQSSSSPSSYCQLIVPHFLPQSPRNVLWQWLEMQFLRHRAGLRGVCLCGIWNPSPGQLCSLGLKFAQQRSHPVLFSALNID